MANLIGAKRIDSGYNVYGYCFATPATTTYTGAATARYDSIFNIINEDDLVPQLPLSDWAFKRYGEDVTGSIENSYASQWDALVSGDVTYVSGKTAMLNTVNALSGIAEDRDECYVVPNDGCVTSGFYLNDQSAEQAADDLFNSYPRNAQPYCNWIPINAGPYYAYKMYHQPAFLMQLIAAVMGNEITDIEFVLVDVADYLSPAKTQLVFTSNCYEYPHYVESYYLLATKINN